jgi:S-adenosylmethionine hydrolase
MGRIITLTTDFGEGSYVAQMRGVILSLAPEAQIVDVTHHVASGDVRECAYILETVIPAFPEGSIHVAVVDPGVGTDRKALTVHFAGRTLLGPDNGVLTAFLARADTVREISEAALFLPEVSATFHGRDVFAPVAAHLANGVELAAVGPELEGAPAAVPDLYAEGDSGVVIHVDRFGNLITSFPSGALDARPSAGIAAGEVLVTRRARTFGEAEPERPFLYAGSGGRIEVGVRGDSAADRLGWGQGTRLTLLDAEGSEGEEE